MRRNVGRKIESLSMTFQWKNNWQLWNLCTPFSHASWIASEIVDGRQQNVVNGKYKVEIEQKRKKREKTNFVVRKWGV